MKRQGLSPVLVELLVVVLFFAICASINVRVLAEANAMSRDSERQSAALLAATDLCEEIRANPTAFGMFDGDACAFETDAHGLTLKADIRRSDKGSGVYYDFTVSAYEDGQELAVLSGGSYKKEASQ